VDAYQHLRMEGKLAQPLPCPSPGGKTLQRAYQTIGQVAQALTREDYMRVAGISKTWYSRGLCRDMQAAFAHYSPPI
jgi:hypothetical protein